MFLYKKILLLFVACFFLLAGKTQAQTSPYYSVQLTDSIEQDASSAFAYNNVTLVNTFARPITLIVNTTAPDGWRLLGIEQTIIELTPGESTVMPVTLVKLPYAPAEWEMVNLAISLKGTPEVNNYNFFITTPVKRGYLVRAFLKNKELTEYQPFVDIPIKLKNKGNVPESYRININNGFFHLDETVSLHLSPGVDTTYIYKLKISKDCWNDLWEQIVDIDITNKGQQDYRFQFGIKKIGADVKQHDQAYETIPLEVEGGMNNSGPGLTTVYGAVYGAIKISDSSNFTFYYASKQLGIASIAQHDNYLLAYNYKNWKVALGQVMGSDQYYITGRGVSLDYKWNKTDYISIYGIKHYTDTFYGKSANYTSDLVGVNVRYHVKKAAISSGFVSAIDPTHNANSYLETNEANLFNRNGMQLSLIGGVGMYHFTKPDPQLANNVLGLSYGYSFGVSKRNLSIVSSLQNNDNNYPGLYSGYHTQSHTINYRTGRSYIGAFYNSIYTNNDYFKDSVFNLNSVFYNTTYYGAHVGYTDNRMSLTLSAGELSQTGLINAAPQYQTVMLNGSYMLSKQIYFDASSVYGNTAILDRKAKQNDSVILSESLMLGSQYGGVSMLYSRMPASFSQWQNTTGLAEQQPYNVMYTFSPYVNINVMHNKLRGRIQYNYMSSTEYLGYSNVSAYLMYDNKKAGFNILLNVQKTVSKQNEGANNISLTIRKAFNIPNIVKPRKYYDLKLVAYYDENGNGVLDQGEKLLKGVRVTIDNTQFVTNEKGEARYQNIEKGAYKIDLNHGKGVKEGVVPVEGNAQSVAVERNTTKYIAFKKSKYIYGKIIMDLDTLEKKKFSPGDIKVTIVDTAGNVYSTLTDDKGEYSFNVPAGIYTVSLNPGSFDEAMKPLQLSYHANLQINEEACIIFTIQEKKRKVEIKRVSLD